MVCAAAHELGQRGLDIVSCHAQRAGVVVAGAEGDDPQLGAGLTRKGHEAADHLVDHAVPAEGKDGVKSAGAPGYARGVCGSLRPHDLEASGGRGVALEELLGKSGAVFSAAAVSCGICDDERTPKRRARHVLPLSRTQNVRAQAP